jgi:hypothetical protein
MSKKCGRFTRGGEATFMWTNPKQRQQKKGNFYNNEIVYHSRNAKTCCNGNIS